MSCVRKAGLLHFLVSMDVTDFLEQHVSQIDSIIQTTCRKKNINGEQAKDFRSYVYEKLLENDAKRLKDFQGDYKTSWTGYLSIVVTRLAIDFIKKNWGRWENSSAARMLGDAAMKLETLIYRDKYAFTEAAEMMMESLDFSLMYRLSLSEFNLLQTKLPEITAKKLEASVKNTVYLKHDLEAVLKEFLSETECDYIPIILENTEIILTQDLLEEWDLILQGRMPARRSVTTFLNLQKDQEESGLDLIANIPDDATQDPLGSLLDEELEFQLTSYIENLLNSLSDEDWTIIAFFLIDNLRISEIARMLDGNDSGLIQKNNKKTPVSSKSWKHVNKRISYFMKKMKQKIESLGVEKEDQETVSEFCLYLISKKIQKK
jgi:DNA-directed RNA polymerase specialized sigma24 family protein